MSVTPIGDLPVSASAATRPAVATKPNPSPSTRQHPSNEASARRSPALSSTSVTRSATSVLAAPEVTPGSSEPARNGIRGRLNAVLNLRLAPKPESAEMRQRAAIASITGPIPGFSIVTVANPKGGVGKTPIAVGLNSIIAAHRGAASSVCVDVAEVGGSLADRVSVPPRDGQDVLSLIGAEEAEPGSIRPSMLSRYPRSSTRRRRHRRGKRRSQGSGSGLRRRQLCRTDLVPAPRDPHRRHRKQPPCRQLAMGDLTRERPHRAGTSSPRRRCSRTSHAARPRCHRRTSHFVSNDRGHHRRSW